MRTHRNENHLEECPHYFERNPTKLKSKKIGEVSVSIGEDESDTRLDYLYNSIYKKKLVVEQLLEQLLTELLAIQVMKKMSILMQF